MTSNHADNERSWENELAAGPTCLSLERLGEPLSSDERAHVAGCARCEAELRLFAAYADDTPGEDGAVVSEISRQLERRAAEVTARSAPVRPHRLPETLLRWAAGLAVAAGLGYAVLGRQSGPVAPVGSDAVYRSGTVELIGPVGDVESLPAEWTWTPVVGAVRYDAVVSEVDGTVLWTGSSASPRLGLPPAVAHTLIPGKTVMWQIVALDQAERELARSRTQRVRLVGRPPVGGVR